jgi:excisionase family DNA binding protein
MVSKEITLPSKLLSFKEVRTLLNLSTSTLRRNIRDGKLKCIRWGRKLLFDPVVIAQALADRTS